MSAEFQPNGYIQKLIDQHGANSKEVIRAIEFWGPEAGEFAVEAKEPTIEPQLVVVINESSR